MPHKIAFNLEPGYHTYQLKAKQTFSFLSCCVSVALRSVDAPNKNSSVILHEVQLTVLFRMEVSSSSRSITLEG